MRLSSISSSSFLTQEFPKSTPFFALIKLILFEVFMGTLSSLLAFALFYELKFQYVSISSPQKIGQFFSRNKTGGKTFLNKIYPLKDVN